MGTAQTVPEFNCPKCPRKLHYISSIGPADASAERDRSHATVHIYECAVHGGWQLGDEGCFRPYIFGRA